MEKAKQQVPLLYIYFVMHDTLHDKDVINYLLYLLASNACSVLQVVCRRYKDL